MGLRCVAPSQKLTQSASLIVSSSELTGVCTSRKELPRTVVNGLRCCRCEGCFRGHPAREPAHGHDPVSGSAGRLRKDISMARSRGCDGGFESCDDAIGSVVNPRDNRMVRSLTILNCLEFVNALCPACRGCVRDSRTVDGSFLVLRFLL